MAALQQQVSFRRAPVKCLPDTEEKRKYPGFHEIIRAPVNREEAFLPLDAAYTEATPYFTAPHLVGTPDRNGTPTTNIPPYADISPHNLGFSEIKFNELDLLASGAVVDRRSFEGLYATGRYAVRQPSNVDRKWAMLVNLPLNPVARTGLAGRGVLGRFGPNHAADPLVTRWYMVDGHKVLQCVLVIRRDNGQLALPGGIVEPGHTVTATVKKEFGEEALNTLGIPEEDAKVLVQRVQEAFANGVVIYTGYSDDPRNTDNAWLETSVYHFHDEDGTTMARFPLQGGDDAKSAAWFTVNRHLDLYAGHRDFVRMAAERLGAEW